MKKTMIRSIEISFLGMMLLSTSITVSAQIKINGADNTVGLTSHGQEAYKDLLQTKTFTFAAFGYAAVPFRSTQSLIRLLKEKDAEKLLREIVRNADAEGQVYALIGLQVVKSKHFDKEFEFVKQQLKEKGVTHISSEDGGCVSGKYSIKIEEIIKNIQSKEYAKIFSKRYISR
jgi:hypothetical protein